MTGANIGLYLDEVVFLLLAIWASGVGYGYFPPLGKNASAKEKWQSKFGKYFKIFGPVGLVAAVLKIGSHMLGVPI